MTSGSKPRVSICMPVHNGEKYLASAIESALAQTFTDFELIVSDDCSTDASAAIIEKYAAADSRLRSWRNAEQLGLFENYNLCLSRAAGAIIKPFAQDDVLHPLMLDRVVAALDEHPRVALVSTAKRWIGEEGQPLDTFRQFPRTETIPGQKVILYNLLRLTNWVGEPSCVAFRRERIGAGFDADFHHYGDIEYWFRIIDGFDYMYLDEVLCDFRRHNRSASTKNLSGLYFGLDIIRINDKYAHVLREFGEPPEHTRRRATEVIALNLDHLVRQESLTVDDVLRLSGNSAADIALYKKMLFDALQSLTATLAELDDLKCKLQTERQRHEAEISSLRASNSWKVTSPIRNIIDSMRS